MCYNFSGGVVLDKATRDKIRSLDEFYLVEIIRDQNKFGYDDDVVRYTKRILKKRGFSSGDMERIYSEEVKPQDDFVESRAKELYFGFLNLGKAAILVYCVFVVLFVVSLFHGFVLRDAPDFFGVIPFVSVMVFIAAPFVTLSRARKISRLLLGRFDDRASQKLFHQLDDNVWLLLVWYLFIPGFLISFYRTKNRLSGMLIHLGILHDES